MDARRIMGALGLGTVIVLAILLGSSLIVFFNLPSVAFTGVGGLAAWWTMTGRSLPALVTTLRSEHASESDLAAGIETVRAGKRAFWMMGVTGTLIGLVQMLQALDDPSVIGPALAVAILTIVYAMLIDLFALSPIDNQLQIRRCIAHSVGTRAEDLEGDLAASRDAMDELRRRASQATSRTT